MKSAIKHHLTSIICVIIALLIATNTIEVIIVYIMLMWGTAGYMLPDFRANNRQKRKHNKRRSDHHHA